MKHLFIITSLIIAISCNSCSQSAEKKNNLSAAKSKNKGKNIGGCEGCEVIYECPVPFNKLSNTDTLPDFKEQGLSLHISGIIYEHDGKTPAKDAVLYVYHTDQTGHYTDKGNHTGWLRINGYIHGWIKTDEQGRYSFYTLRPAPYPNGHIPAHIHAVVKETNGNNYWIDEYLFDDDSLLTQSEKNKQEKRGGNGIIHLTYENGKWVGTRNIILGMNVPGYNETSQQASLESGLAIGTSCPSFDPLHLSGTDAGTKACPMCKYGYEQGIMIWFNHTNLDQMDEFAQTLENEIEKRGEKNLRVFLIYMNPSYKENDAEGQRILQGKIKKWCDEQNLHKVAVVWVPSPMDERTCGKYNINPKVKNTVLLFKKRMIAAKWININYTNDEVQSFLKMLRYKKSALLSGRM